MRQKEINVFYAVDNIDNTKTTLFAVEGKASKEMIREALEEYDEYLLSDDEKRFEEEVERAYGGGECSFGDTEFFFDSTILYYE